jgi:hypothetical protein
VPLTTDPGRQTGRLGKRKRAENAKLASEPTMISEGKFSTIIVDLPWEMKKIERDVQPNQVEFE